MQWERTRVPITLTPTCTQPPGSRPQTLRVSTHGQRAAPFRRSLTSLHGDAVGIFYALTDRAVDDSNIENNNVHETIISEVSPWTLHHPKVNLDLSELSKKYTPAPLFIQKFNEIKDDLSYCTPVYTDGSKDNDRVGCGAIINDLSIKQRLPSNASIFTAEATAIDLALDAITESDDDHFIFF